MRLASASPRRLLACPTPPIAQLADWIAPLPPLPSLPLLSNQSHMSMLLVSTNGFPARQLQGTGSDL